MTLKNYLHLVAIFSVLLLSSVSASSQMRKIYLDETDSDNDIEKISFYANNEGYVAFTKWIGYTTDSGRTFTRKYISLSNVDYNGYPANLTFGFGINGVIAFNKNNLIVYGHYGLVPSILTSTDGGNSFKLVYHSQYNPSQLSGGITDMIFPGNGSTGYAIDADRVLKTTNQGISWTSVRNDPGSFYERIVAPDISNLFVFSSYQQSNKLVRSANAGASWQPVTVPSLPQPKLLSVFFLDANTGWLNMYDANNLGHVFKTTNGGINWNLLNDPVAASFRSDQLYFLDQNTGYAVSGIYVSKTTDGGALWEPFVKNHSLPHWLNDLQVKNGTLMWAGGDNGLLELNTNPAGPTLPKAFFKIDTAGYSLSGNVQLLNFSKTGYSYRWLLNGSQFSTSYNSSYQHDKNRQTDTIRLIVSNGIYADTTVSLQTFYPPVLISTFSPNTASQGNEVSITGANFTGVTEVSFGGVKAAGFTVQNSGSIKAIVGNGATGRVKVVTTTGRDSLAGFTYIAGLSISSFSPTASTAGSTITINGSNFINVTGVSFAGLAAVSFSVVSPSQITAVTPSGGSGNIVLSTATGSQSIGGYVALPSIQSFSPTSGTDGTIMTIKGSSFTGITAVTVGGVPAGSFTVGSADSIMAVLGAGATGNVVVTKTGGTASKAGFSWFAAPVVASFSPMSGPVGTTVTISGSGFDPVASNNTVYFGTVKATVTASSPTAITVLIPAGASFENISVTAHNLVGYSVTPFLVTFANGGSITSHSFSLADSITQYDQVDHVQVADLDGDGKLDIALAISWTGLRLYRNSSNAVVSFDPPVSLTNALDGPFCLKDIDGDGKPDIIAFERYANQLIVYRNISAPGTIAFEQPLRFSTSSGTLQDMFLGDMDADGKTDIVLAEGQLLSTLRNISNPGKIAFEPSLLLLQQSIYSVLLQDLNHDQRPELIFSSVENDSFYVARNTSAIGLISIGPVKGFEGTSRQEMIAVDMDIDGNPDLVSIDVNSSQLFFYRNISSQVNILFAAATAAPAGYYPLSLAAADLDGDGKPDIATALSYPEKAGLYKNQSTPGNIILAPPVNLSHCPTCETMRQVQVGDVNGDGKPDLLATSDYPYQVRILLNTVRPEPFISSFSPSMAVTGMAVEIKGGNFTNVTAVYFGDQPAASFTVRSSGHITAVVASGATGEVSVTNHEGTGRRPGFSFGLAPFIEAISPVSGPAGSSVTITGSNFSPVAGQNKVFLGTVQATVTAATATALTVTVPAGPSDQPFSVTVNELTGYSDQHFIQTFPGAAPVFTSSSFAAYPINVQGYTGKACDLDGDGKPDLVSTYGWNEIHINRNTGSGGVFSFAATINISAATMVAHLFFGDVDGDGKQDMLGQEYSGSKLYIWLNNSTPGNISMVYAGAVATSRFNYPAYSTLRDVDADGKPDLVATHRSANTVSVFKNRCKAGMIAFDEPLAYGCSFYPETVTARDLDADHQPELLVAAQVVNIFGNTGEPGTLAFTPKKSFAAGDWPQGIVAADLDNDGKPEVLTANLNGNSVSVLHNQSTQGNIMMADAMELATGSGPYYILTSDLDGDGKLEVIAKHGAISVFKNASTAGNIKFLHNQDIFEGGHIEIADMDVDGKPDIIVFRNNDSALIYRNQAGVPVGNKTICANGNTTITAGVTGTAYQWQLDDGSGFVNTGNNSHISGANTANLQLLNVPSAWYGYKFRCISNTGTGATSIIQIGNTWIGGVSNQWNNPANWSCGTVPDGNTDVIINSGSVLLSTDASVRSLTLKPGVTFSIATGYTLTITH